ncbi:MAG: hypothetical protein V4640_01675 [Verrucomicrobiota bacterium]
MTIPLLITTMRIMGIILKLMGMITMERTTITTTNAARMGSH